MDRVHGHGFTAAISRGFDLIPVGLHRFIRPDFLCGIDPVFAGLHAFESASYGRSYRDTAHCAYPVHQFGLPKSRRRTTVVLPTPHSPEVIVHELGHVLHESTEETIMPLRGHNAAATLITGTALAITTNGTAVNTSSNSAIVVYLNVSAVTGETPTLNIKLQDSPDGTTWYDVASATFTEATGATTERKVFTNIGDYIRAVATIAGTLPAFTFTVKATSIT